MASNLTLQHLVRYRGDASTLSIALTHPDTGAAYTPGGGEVLIFTAKKSIDDVDTGSRCQKDTITGGMTLANPSVVTLVPGDFSLTALEPGVLYEFDITSDRDLTVARGELYFEADVTIERTRSVSTNVVGAPGLDWLQVPTLVNGRVLSNNGTALTWITAGAGTVTSVALALPNIFSVSGSPVTTTGTLTAALATQAANLVFAGPSTGAAAAPTFRSLALADIPLVGSASGLATLDGTGKLTASQLPDLAVTDYLGSVASQAAMLALTGQRGDWCNRSDLGTVFIITGSDPTQLSSWTQLNYPTAPVTSVASRTGAITLAQADIAGLTTADSPTHAALKIAGTAGAGYVDLLYQSSAPAAPAASHVQLYADSTGRLSWVKPDGFTRTFDGAGNTASRVYTLPDVSSTFLMLANPAAGVAVTNLNSITSVAGQNLVLALGTGGTALTITNSTLAATFAGSLSATGSVTATATGDNFILDSSAAANVVYQTFKLGGTTKGFVGISASGNAINTGSLNGSLVFRSQGFGFSFSADSGATQHLVIGSSVANFTGITTSGTATTAAAILGKSMGLTENLWVGGSVNMATGQGVAWPAWQIYQIGSNFAVRDLTNSVNLMTYVGGTGVNGQALLAGTLTVSGTGTSSFAGNLNVTSASRLQNTWNGSASVNSGQTTDLILNRSRAGTTEIINNDSVATLQFGGYINSSYQSITQIQGYVSGVTGSAGTFAGTGNLEFRVRGLTAGSTVDGVGLLLSSTSAGAMSATFGGTITANGITSTTTATDALVLSGTTNGNTLNIQFAGKDSGATARTGYVRWSPATGTNQSVFDFYGTAGSVASFRSDGLSTLSSLTLTSTTPATTTSSGALQLPGIGMGNGAIFAATLNLSGNLTANNLVITPTTLTYAGTTNIDASGAGIRDLALTGNVTFTTSNLVAGRSVTIRIVCDASNRTFTFPGGWTWLNSAPANILANKTGFLVLTPFGTSDSTVTASWAVQA